MRIRSLAAAIILSGLALGNAARADLVVSIGNTSLTAGAGASYVDVMVRSTGAAVDVTQFSVNFQITDNAGTTSVLQFVSPQGHAYVNLSNYIFSKNSGEVLDNNNNSPIQVSSPYQAATGGDFAADFTDVSVSGAVLLTRLYLTDTPVGVGAGLTPKAGDSFKVTLTSGSYSDGTQGSFATTSGTVNIVGPSTVPEPASMLLLLIGGTSFAATRKRPMFDAG